MDTTTLADLAAAEATARTVVDAARAALTAAQDETTRIAGSMTGVLHPERFHAALEAQERAMVEVWRAETEWLAASRATVRARYGLPI